MDDRLRALERAAEGGDAAARGALLAERLRLRRISIEGLRLAAYLGDAGARLCLNVPAPGPTVDLVPRLRGLAPWGQDVLGRALRRLARMTHLEGDLDVSAWAFEAQQFERMVEGLRRAGRARGLGDADLWAAVVDELAPWALADTGPR